MTHKHCDRRNFIQKTALGVLAPCSVVKAITTDRKQAFQLSLAEWSLHRSLQQNRLDNLDFAKVTREEFGLGAIEYVNTFFKDKARDDRYLVKLNTRASDHGVKQLLIMVDGEGDLGDPDSSKRKVAVANHHQWIEAAKQLGCHSIRVNARSKGSYEEQLKLAVDGLSALSEYGLKYGINVIVENHGGLSSNGRWLTAVLRRVNSPVCGSLPDFGNFYEYDRYRGVEELMPFAKAVSAKSHDFDEMGNETATDYFRMMKIVLQAGYSGFVGIEYEGTRLKEYAGIHATKRLLERILAANA
ncbi:MAG: sugar phosphate isomerase/epimerase family protein [Planctomycetota bacterium]|nr:sugar phosphate isomerase/epimerase family protein [Planctomycetota bacterium]